MKTRFSDRMDAGEFLAAKLKSYANRDDVLVLALPRGGVPVGFIVAQRLQVPLDVIVVRKIGVPGHQELTMGALGGGGMQVMNEDLIESLQIPSILIDQVVAQEEGELKRRERIYCHDRPMPVIKDRTIILVDDGIATGAIIRAAISVVRAQGAHRIVVATPVMAAATHTEMYRDVDEIVTVLLPSQFYGAAQWYEDFSPTTDEEVKTLLASADHSLSPP